MDKKEETSGGIGFIGILTIILVAAKAFGFAHYSWFVAFMPLVVSVTVIIGIVLIAGIVSGIAEIIKNHSDQS